MHGCHMPRRWTTFIFSCFFPVFFVISIFNLKFVRCSCSRVQHDERLTRKITDWISWWQPARIGPLSFCSDCYSILDIQDHLLLHTNETSLWCFIKEQFVLCFQYQGENFVCFSPEQITEFVCLSFLLKFEPIIYLCYSL